jgi:phospholipid/cholesterol/gamma-HCH transport system permease protein
MAEWAGEAVRFCLAGSWTIDAASVLETGADDLLREAGGARRATFDLSGVERLDTAGAWLIDRTRRRLAEGGIDTSVDHVRSEYDILLREAHFRTFETPAKPRPNYVFELLADVGESIVATGKDFYNGVSFLGEVVAGFAKSLVSPSRFRGTPLVFHIEQIAFRSVPIIVLINFLVGCIVAQQGIYQLMRFGASTFAVNLIGILTLRELGVLLTSIMIAGRSGSAITAELGSMKMREEIDALRVMGLRPIEVLIVPRLLALIISMPLLTFLADMAALFGGLVVGWAYGSISPEIFMSRLQESVGLSTFFVGILKAPFMALVIGVIASIEGLAVGGSAESLGQRVTASVVKSIFMVIVVDGIFAIFFAAIRY